MEDCLRVDNTVRVLEDLCDGIPTMHDGAPAWTSQYGALWT